MKMCKMIIPAPLLNVLSDMLKWTIDILCGEVKKFSQSVDKMTESQNPPQNTFSSISVVGETSVLSTLNILYYGI